MSFTVRRYVPVSRVGTRNVGTSPANIRLLSGSMSPSVMISSSPSVAFQLPSSVNPVPVIVTFVPVGPLEGLIITIIRPILKAVVPLM